AVTHAVVVEIAEEPVARSSGVVGSADNCQIVAVHQTVEIAVGAFRVADENGSAVDGLAAESGVGCDAEAGEEGVVNVADGKGDSVAAAGSAGGGRVDSAGAVPRGVEEAGAAAAGDDIVFDRRQWRG